MTTSQTTSWPPCRAESSAKGIHPFYSDVRGLTSFGEVRTLAPYPAPCKFTAPPAPSR